MMQETIKLPSSVIETSDLSLLVSPHPENTLDNLFVCFTGISNHCRISLHLHLLKNRFPLPFPLSNGKTSPRDSYLNLWFPDQLPSDVMTQTPGIYSHRYNLRARVGLSKSNEVQLKENSSAFSFRNSADPVNTPRTSTCYPLYQQKHSGKQTGECEAAKLTNDTLIHHSPGDLVFHSMWDSQKVENKCLQPSTHKTGYEEI